MHKPFIWNVDYMGLFISLVIGLGCMLLARSSTLVTTHAFSKNLLTAFVAIKMLGSWVQQAIYTFHYTNRSTSDVYRFFDDGLYLKSIFAETPLDYFKVLFNLHSDSENFRTLYFENMNAWLKPFESGFYNDNHIMIKLNSLMAFFTGELYEVHSILFTLIGMAGTILLIMAMIRPKHRNAALMISALLPSSTLWLVGGLKETVLILGLGLLLMGALYPSIKRLQSWALITIGLLILSSIKIYALLALLPCLVIYKLAQWKSLTNINTWLILATAFLAGYIVLWQTGFDIAAQISTKQNEFINHMNETAAGSSFSVTRLKPSINALLVYSPNALINVMARPIFPTSIAESLLIMENVIFIGLLLLAVYQQKPSLRLLNKLGSITWVLPFVILSLILIGLTTPVFGAIMRYRAPFYLIIIISISPHISEFFNKTQHEK